MNPASVARWGRVVMSGRRAMSARVVRLGLVASAANGANLARVVNPARLDVTAPTVRRERWWKWARFGMPA